LRAWLASKNVKHVDIETPGAHTWMVWRRNLTEIQFTAFPLRPTMKKMNAIFEER